MLYTEEQRELLALVGEIRVKELAPQAAEFEAASRFPREVFRLLGRSGLLSLAYPAEVGGGGQPYEIYLQVLEEVAASWASVAVGMSVHSLAVFPTYAFGSARQRHRLADFLGGDLLGAYCLSEPHAGSDPAAIKTRAVRTDEGFRLNGTKAWVTHGGEADFYNVFARLEVELGGI